MTGQLIRWLIRGKASSVHVRDGDKTRCGININTVQGELMGVGGGTMCKQCQRKGKQ